MNLSEIENITGEKSKIDKRTFTVVTYSPVFIGSRIDKNRRIRDYSISSFIYFRLLPGNIFKKELLLSSLILLYLSDRGLIREKAWIFTAEAERLIFLISRKYMNTICMI